MRLANTLAAYELEFGGPGSGCHGDNCGRPTSVMHEKLAGPSGTNPGGRYRGSDGVERYVKLYSNAVQAYGEVLANNIYRDLGLSAPKSQAFSHEGKVAVANDIMPGHELGASNITPQIAKEILKGFAADVLTANWDAVGLEHDNVLVNGSTVSRIDNGGTFLMRAQGGLKPDSLLNKIGETQSLLDRHINPAYAAVADKADVLSYKEVPDLHKQIRDIAALEKASGGWRNYVNSVAGDMPSNAKDKVVAMLESRTKLLKELE